MRSYINHLIVGSVSAVILSSCATLKPVEKTNVNGYLLAPTNTILNGTQHPRYRFVFRFGVQELQSGEISYFDVSGDNKHHAAVKRIPPGYYKLYSEQRRYKNGGGDDIQLLPDSMYPLYEPFEFQVEPGRITILPWYFGVDKFVAPDFDSDSESAVSEPLMMQDLCKPLKDSQRNWVQIWGDDIDNFNDYRKLNRVIFQYNDNIVGQCPP